MSLIVSVTITGCDSKPDTNTGNSSYGSVVQSTNDQFALKACKTELSDLKTTHQQCTTEFEALKLKTKQNKAQQTSDADALTEAKEEIEQANYAHAYAIWLPLAKKNNNEAIYNLGWLYHNGYGVAVNNETAAEWWEKAAANGNVEALFDIGNIYYHGGGGVKRDVKEAVTWFIKAAEQGNEEAQTLLAGLLKVNHYGIKGSEERIKQALDNEEVE